MVSDLKLGLFAKPKSCTQNTPKHHSTSANSRHQTRSTSHLPDQKQGCRLNPIADRQQLTDRNCVAQRTETLSPSKANTLPLKRTGENRQPETKTDRRRERRPKMSKVSKLQSDIQTRKSVSTLYVGKRFNKNSQKTARKPLKISQWRSNGLWITLWKTCG